MTTLKLGYTNPLTDSFGGHPQLGAVLDLNDGQVFVAVSPDGVELAPPPKTLVPQGNIRTQGERMTRAVYRHNREAVVRLILGPGASYAALIASVRTLLSWVNAPPQVPVTLLWQPPSASAPVYLDVVGAACDISSDEGEWLGLQLEPLEVVLLCRPGLRGDRVTLQNLVCNPGFEAGAGGLMAGGQNGTIVFADSLATTGAYTVLAGGPLTTPDKGYFPDTLLGMAGANLLRFYRLDEGSGTVVVDASAQQQAGTTHGSPTQGVGGGLTGDTDTAYTLTATSSQYVSIPNTGLPTGNGAMSLGMLFKFAANPAANILLWGYGSASVAHQGLNVFVDTSGKLNVNNGSATITAAVASTTGVWHLAVVTWDGTTLALYVDNAAAVTNGSLGNQAIGAGPTVNLGADATPSHYWNGQVDEAFILGSALTGGNVASLYTAMTSSPANEADSMTLPSGTRISFGDGNWGAYANWQARVRYFAGGTVTFYLHYTDASNYLAGVVSPTGLTVNQTIAGVVHQLGSTAFVPVNGVSYWVRLLQMQETVPATLAGNPVFVSISVYADLGGTMGGQIATASGGSFDLVTALTGGPQIAVSGAGLGMGGPYGGSAGVHRVALAGPGGWVFSTSGTGMAFGNWDQTPANCYAGGPQQSVGAARIDAGPAGTLNAQWTNQAAASGPLPAGQTMMPGSSGQVLRASVWVRSVGVGVSCAQALQVAEYDVNGALLRTTTVASVNGAQAAWTQLAGSVTLGASTAYALVVLGAVDATSGSAGGSIWWDNAQCWNQTTTGQTSMPYCELRFNQSPCQLLLSGLLGDLAAPAYVAWGTYLSSFAAGGALTYALGRRGQVSAKGQLVASANGNYGVVLTPQASEIADASSFGGSYSKASVSGPLSWAPRGMSPVVGDLLGVYHLLCRFRSQDVSPTAVGVRVKSDQNLDAFWIDSGTLRALGTYYGPYAYPLSTTGQWTVSDAGQVSIPPFAQGALADPGQSYVVPRPEWAGSSATSYEGDADWEMLLPVDGSLVLGVVNYPGNSSVPSITNSWLWGYLDGLLSNRGAVGDGPAWTYSLETGALPAPGHGGGGPGTTSSGSVNINSAADPALTLDPTLTLSGQSGGINQVGAVVYDQNAGVLPLYAEVQYSPLYLYPR